MPENNRNDLTTGSVWRKLLGFFFPVLFGMLFQQLYNTVDAVIVGHYIGDAALAAVGGSPAVLTGMVIGFFTGLNSGATVLISQHFGANDTDGLRRVLHTGIVFCTAVGIVVTALGFVGAPYVLRLVNTPADIMDDSVLYLRIYFVGAVPLLLYNLFQGTLQGVGDSVRPLRYLIISCCANILLDLLFVAKLDMGVAGVGWASVVSMTLCTLIAIRYLLCTDGPHRVVLSCLRISGEKLRDIMRIGLPAGLQGVMYSLANIIIQVSVNSFGTGIVAAWTATERLDGFYWVTSNAFGVTICAFVGQCYGAGKTERMKASVRLCLLIALGVTVTLSCTLLCIARPAFGVFLRDPEVIDAAVRILWYFVPFYFIWTFIEVLTGTFRGAGDTLRPMIITMLGTCVLRIVWMFTVVPRWHHIFTVSIVYAISWLVTGGVFIVYYLKGSWLRKRD